MEILDYIDEDFDQANLQKIIGEIAGYLRQYRPHIAITFDPWGAYGHPDHIAICQLTTAAVTCAADPDFPSKWEDAKRSTAVVSSCQAVLLGILTRVR